MELLNLLIPPVFADHAAHCGTGDTPAQLAGCAEFLFGNIVSILITVAGIAFFFMLIAGGFRYLTSGGDPKAVAAAGNTLTWAIAGMLIILVTWFILLLVQNLTGVCVTIFRISPIRPSPCLF